MLVEYDVSAHTIYIAKPLQSEGHFQKHCHFFFFAVFILKLQYKSAMRGGIQLSEIVSQTKQTILA